MIIAHIYIHTYIYICPSGVFAQLIKTKRSPSGSSHTPLCGTVSAPTATGGGQHGICREKILLSSPHVQRAKFWGTSKEYRTNTLRRYQKEMKTAGISSSYPALKSFLSSPSHLPAKATDWCILFLAHLHPSLSCSASH